MTPEERNRMLDRPAVTPPHNLTSNFDNPTEYRPWWLPVQITLFTLLTLIVGAWMIVKLRVTKKVLIEDYVIFLAYLEFLVFMTFVFMMSDHRLGAHMWDITIRTRIKLFKLYYDSVLLYFVIMVTIRVGVILQLVRTFVPGGVRDTVWWTAHVMLWVNIVFYFVNFVVELKYCTPRAKEWDPTIEGGSCLNASEVRFVIAILNVLSDLIIIFLPQRIIWKLNQPLKARLKLSVLFLFGIFSMACGCVQIYLGIDMSIDKMDKSYKISNSAIWAVLEVMSGFLVACSPVIPKFLTLVWRTTSSSRIGTTFRTLLRISSNGSRGRSNGPAEDEILTIGRLPERNRRPGVSDIDYDNLMEDTIDGTKSGPDNISLRELSTHSDGSLRRERQVT
ncbi:hypothetical protein DM02DRAFT_675611 [Periconia macrospinosa]|uniref:Rhodopsin domain-containing protein n=1 Tax=Periconia macrospinosa TaxID=97972 RepID=A0A2V1DB34_9PLEO|nr:hypothetical protein DM02DRAFT_675611 [Periconia macrospinosa]